MTSPSHDPKKAPRLALTVAGIIFLASGAYSFIDPGPLKNIGLEDEMATIFSVMLAGIGVFDLILAQTLFKQKDETR